MSDPVRPIGVSGLKTSGGAVTEEWLVELQGERWDRALRQMTDQDPLISGILFAIEMLVRQVSWSIAPASDDPADSAAADFVRECFGAMEPEWEDALAELLTMVPWGWAALELVYVRRADGRYGWAGWEPRSQDTRSAWEWDAQGRWTALIQLAPPAYRQVTIPRDRLLHVTTTSRKQSPEGRSALRGCYRPWYFKSRIETIEGIGVERDLAGLPVADVPPELLADTASDADKAILAEIKKIVTGIRNDEQGGVVWPLAYDARGNETYRLRLLSTGGQRAFDTGAIVTRYDQRIAASLLADFILLGAASVGSFALSSDKTRLFAVALGAWLASIARAVETQAFARLLALNGMAGRPPRLTHSDIESADLGALGSFIDSLARAGVLTLPNAPLEAELLRQANLPPPA